jgi:hypothetical protein
LDESGILNLYEYGLLNEEEFITHMSAVVNIPSRSDPSNVKKKLKEYFKRKYGENNTILKNKSSENIAKTKLKEKDQELNKNANGKEPKDQ